MNNIYVLHNNRLLHFGSIDIGGDDGSSTYSGKVPLRAGDRLDFVAGTGILNDDSHTTGVKITIRTPDSQTHDPSTELPTDSKANAAWSCGYLAGDAAPNAATFRPFPKPEIIDVAAKGPPEIGGLSNPGSTVWENGMADLHPYQPVPHTVGLIHTFRTLSGRGKPVFASEYGVGSAVDLVRTVQHYDRLGKENAEDALFYRRQLDRFLVDWKQWNMAPVFGRPEDFFAASQRKMATDRWIGINALRANPKVIGYSLTGTVDQGMTGEGLFTTWRELKPGTIDAMFDALAPLRWCLFAEPANVYSGTKVRLDAVLANEDRLAPGEYPARVQLFGPDNQLVWEKQTSVSIPAKSNRELPPALPVVSEEVVVRGPPGKYRLTASFDRGAAPAGREATLYVADPAGLPKFSGRVSVWGDDPELTAWLTAHGVDWRPFAAEQTEREVILVGFRAPEPAAKQFPELARHVARGSTAVFISPESSAEGADTGRWLPLVHKGVRRGIGHWLYHKDEWARPHPIFDGLPTGMLDYIYYRDVIPDRVWVLPDAPDETVAGAINAAVNYTSGVVMAVNRFGAGRCVLNAMRIRENLGQHPVADRLLMNLIQYAAKGSDRPLEPLPADFDQTLKAIGY